jgi:hypothetical protein
MLYPEILFMRFQKRRAMVPSEIGDQRIGGKN